jgi:hypothetical protein
VEVRARETERCAPIRFGELTPNQVFSSHETLCSETRSLTSTAAIPNSTIQHENDSGADTSDEWKLLTESVILARCTVRIVAPMVE